MSTYTMPLKEVIENVYGTEHVQRYEPPRETVTFNGITYGDIPVLPDSGEAIGLAQYPIFNENYRPILNGKLIDEYWNREIGVETISNFTLVLRRKMQQVMPYYNKLYETEAIQYDPLQTMDIHSVSSGGINATETANGTNTVESENVSGSRVVNSDTPQTFLSGSGDYATSGTDANSKADVSSNAEQNSESTTETETNNDNRVTGFQGIASNLMVQFRSSLINIDTMVLDELTDCFMQILDNNDSFTNDQYNIAHGSLWPYFRSYGYFGMGF